MRSNWLILPRPPLPGTSEANLWILQVCVWDPYIQGATRSLNLSNVGLPNRYCLNRYHNTSSVSSMLNWQTLKKGRRNISRLIMLNKIVNGVVAIPSYPYLQPKLRSSRTHPLGFHPYQTNIDTFKYSFFPRTITTAIPCHRCTLQQCPYQMQSTYTTAV